MSHDEGSGCGLLSKEDMGTRATSLHPLDPPLLIPSPRDEIVINTGSWVGGLLVDGLGDGALIEAPHEDLEYLRTTSFGLLQGSRMRNTKTEYVSCPSCGRTLFNLQEVTEQIRWGETAIKIIPRPFS